MKRAFLLIVVPTLLVALGFAQSPATSVNTDQTIKGCLGGSDGNYTVVEDGTGRILKISTASVDFKQHLGHDVTLIGHSASGASSGAADNSFAVTELNMISEHCAAAAAAAPIAAIGTPSESATKPPASPSVPVATTSTLAQTEIASAAPAATTVTAPAETAVTPPASATPPGETVVTATAAPAPPAEIAVTPAVAATPPDETVSTPRDKPVADAAHPTRLPATSGKLSAKSAEVATAPAKTASTPVKTARTPEAAATPATTASTPAETATTPDAAPTTPVAPARHGALFLLILIGVLVIVMGTMVPVLGRWRKRRMLERTGAQNLSFTREASSSQDKPEQPRKAA